MPSTTTEHLYWEDRSETFDEDNSYIVGAELIDDIKKWVQRQFTHAEMLCWNWAAGPASSQKR